MPNSNPTIKPLLHFLRTPTPRGITGGGKNADGIRNELLAKRQKYLSRRVDEIYKSDVDELEFSGIIHLIAKMDENSLSPSWTPDDIFSEAQGCRIVCPAYKGFLIEANRDQLPTLSKKITSPKNDRERVDISRIDSIAVFDAPETMRGETVESIWNSDKSYDEHKSFNIWLKPFKNIQARKSLSKKLKETLTSSEVQFGPPEFELSENGKLDEIQSITTLFRYRLCKFLCIYQQ